MPQDRVSFLTALETCSGYNMTLLSNKDEALYEKVVAGIAEGKYEKRHLVWMGVKMSATDSRWYYMKAGQEV